jgi:hypothetical protein
VAQRFSHTFSSIEGTDLREYMSGVRSLPSSRFEPPLFFAQHHDGFQETLFNSERHQAGTKLTQNGMIESRISQFEAQALLPIEPTAHGIGCLPIREILQKREDGAPGSVSWLPTPWIQISKHFIVGERPYCVTKPNGEISLWEGRMYNTNGLPWDFRNRLRFHGHRWSPALEMER